MSAEAALSAYPVEVFVPLLNRGTGAVRPTQGLALAPNQIEVFAAPDYDPTIEEWAFPPGSTVTCTTELRGGRQLLVARHRIA